MKLAKYEFVDKSQADNKINALPENHAHAIVRLGHIIIEQEQESEKYHVDVMWNGIEEHPYGWKSFAVAVADGNGVHSFYGVDYQLNKM